MSKTFSSVRTAKIIGPMKKFSRAIKFQNCQTNLFFEVRSLKSYFLDAKLKIFHFFGIFSLLENYFFQDQFCQRFYANCFFPI